MKLVLRLPMPATPRSRYYAVSGFLHVVAGLALILSPLLGAGPRISQDAPLVVDMVGSVPGAARPPAPKVEPPAPKPPEPAPEGVRAEPEVPPEPKPESKPPEKKKEPKPEPEPKAEPVESPPVAAPQAAPEGGGLGPATGGTSVASAELASVENAWYATAMNGAIQGSWVKPFLEGSREPLKVTVAFNILRDGTAANPRVVATSGMPALDRSALRAVADASPFPPLPAVWGKSFITAEAVFTLEPGER